jgi:hypothetical protein
MNLDLEVRVEILLRVGLKLDEILESGHSSDYTLQGPDCAELGISLLTGCAAEKASSGSEQSFDGGAEVGAPLDSEGRRGESVML